MNRTHVKFTCKQPCDNQYVAFTEEQKINMAKSMIHTPICIDIDNSLSCNVTRHDSKVVGTITNAEYLPEENCYSITGALWDTSIDFMQGSDIITAFNLASVDI